MPIYNRNASDPSAPPNYWLDYRVHGERIREPGCGRNKQASERLLAKRLREIEAGTWKRPELRGENLTLAQYAERWSAVREAEGVKTWADEASRLRDHVLPTLGHMPLSAISRADVKSLIGSLAISGALAPRSVRHVYGALRSLYSRAVEDEIVVTTPCTLRTKRGELPPKKDRDPRWRHTAMFTVEEVDALIGDERIPWNRRVFYALLFLTGQRFGEAAGRQWQDWDRTARPLTKLIVATQYDGQELKSPTGSAPTRYVPVHATLEAMLTDWRDQGFAFTYGRDPQPTDWLVPSLKDMGLRTIRNGLKRLKQDCQTLQIRERTQHDARRTMSTLLREQGVARDLVGVLTHGETTSSTLDHYLVWQWPVLCDAVSRLPITAPPVWSHFGHSLGLGAADPPVFQGDQWRGGRDSNPRPPA